MLATAVRHGVRIIGAILLFGLLAGCATGKGLREECGSNDECESECCFPSSNSAPFCVTGKSCMGGLGGGGIQTPAGGACAYYNSQLNRILCEQRSGASACSGKFWSGQSCAGLNCPLGATSPSQCTIPGASSGGGSCTSSYQGPQGDVQVMTQCASVYNYRCLQKNTSAADQNCKVYCSLEATVSCPYCPACP